MPDKGKIMSQNYYERQNKLIELCKESFIRKEIKANEVVKSLKLIGFSEAMAASRVQEWAAQLNTYAAETDKTIIRRLKQQASLEKYFSLTVLGEEHYELRSKYLNKELSRDETVTKLMQSGCSRKFAECNVDKWEKWRDGKACN